MRRRKDEDARWTNKDGKSDDDDKDHVNIDKEHKQIRRYAVTDASVHESQVFDGLLDEENSDQSLWADSGYRSEARGEQLRERGYKRRLHRKRSSRRALDKQTQATNHRRSKVRARVGYVFGDQHTRQGSILVRSKGKVSAAVKIGLMNLAYTMRWLAFLLAPQSAC